MRTQSQFDEYLRHVVNGLCQTEVSYNAVVNQAMYFPYQPVDVTLPAVGTWTVYMLTSLRDVKIVYIGSSRDLRRRLNTHNKGKGSNMTNYEAYLPFGLVGYIVGFGDRHSDKSITLRFERLWYEENQKKQKRNRGMLRCSGMVAIGQQLVEEWNKRENNKQVTYIVCGMIV